MIRVYRVFAGRDYTASGSNLPDAPRRNNVQIKAIYFYRFHRDPFVPPKEETIRSPGKKIDLSRLSATELEHIHGHLTIQRLCKGRLMKDNLRLYVETDGSPILVDADGCVKRGRDEYYIMPSAYLHLHYRLLRYAEGD